MDTAIIIYNFEGEGVLWFIYFDHFYESSCNFCVNSAKPDRTPQFAATDLGMHCLQKPLYWMSGVDGLQLSSDSCCFFVRDELLFCVLFNGTSVISGE